MKTLRIIPQAINGEVYGDFDDEQLVRPAYCYLHGELEYLFGYDIFYFLKEDLEENQISECSRYLHEDFKEGIYPCKFEDKECTFFIWQDATSNHGLVVFNSDTKAYEEAKQCYDEKFLTV
jgi:hypothetical protein